MKGIVSGIVVFAGMTLLMIMVVYPSLFTFIKDLFPRNSDLSTIVALVACVLITGIAFQVAVLISVLVVAVVNVIFNEDKYSKFTRGRR